MKQTAVEWIVEQLAPSVSLQQKYIDELLDQAKAMEKEQIKSAYERAITNYGMPPLEQFKQDNL